MDSKFSIAPQRVRFFLTHLAAGVLGAFAVLLLGRSHYSRALAMMKCYEARQLYSAVRKTRPFFFWAKPEVKIAAITSP
jgi:hypothetical protein